MRKLGYVVAVTLVFAGCGSDDSDTSSGSGGTSSGGTSSGGTSSGGTGGTSTGGTSSGGTAGTATGGTAGTATGGTAGTASGGTAGSATGGAAGGGGKPNLDAGIGGKPGTDGGGSGCSSSLECKKFSSYCANAACQCIPLGINEQEPKCQGGQVTCIVDPCLNKQAVCANGQCVIQP